jgi:hypothetical protein
MRYRVLVTWTDADLTPTVSYETSDLEGKRVLGTTDLRGRPDPWVLHAQEAHERMLPHLFP